MANVTAVTVMGFCCNDIIKPFAELLRKKIAEMSDGHKDFELKNCIESDLGERLKDRSGGRKNCGLETWAWCDRTLNEEALKLIVDEFYKLEGDNDDSLMLRIYHEGSCERYDGTYFHHNTFGEIYVRDGQELREMELYQQGYEEPPEGFVRVRYGERANNG